MPTFFPSLPISISVENIFRRFTKIPEGKRSLASRAHLETQREIQDDVNADLIARFLCPLPRREDIPRTLTNKPILYAEDASPILTETTAPRLVLDTTNLEMAYENTLDAYEPQGFLSTILEDDEEWLPLLRASRVRTTVT